MFFQSLFFHPTIFFLACRGPERLNDSIIIFLRLQDLLLPFVCRDSFFPLYRWFDSFLRLLGLFFSRCLQGAIFPHRFKTWFTLSFSGCDSPYSLQDVISLIVFKAWWLLSISRHDYSFRFEGMITLIAFKGWLLPLSSGHDIEYYWFINCLTNHNHSIIFNRLHLIPIDL